VDECKPLVGGHARCVERLLAAGASPLATTNFKETALHLAARGGWGPACHLLPPRRQRICE
jgi:Asp-tRNA(Asn)/Glu-tRNA(Gln) amidotransferase A subunit family amidase